MTVTMSRLLQFLIEHHGNNVTKDEILSQVWETHGLRASTHSMNKYISELRQMFRTLGVSEEVIVTIPRVGFSIPETVMVSLLVSKGGLDDLPAPESIPKGKSYYFNNYRVILLIAMVVFFLGALIYTFYTDTNDGGEDIYTTAQETYPIGMIDACPVVALKPIAENLKPRNMEITRDILKRLSITCEAESLYYVRFSDDVIYHQPGRVFLADCSIRDRKAGSLSSCYNYYGTDYETND
nr:winged helix-turn-helix domain-containing protein [Citrobacter sp. JGM124]